MNRLYALSHPFQSSFTFPHQPLLCTLRHHRLHLFIIQSRSQDAQLRHYILLNEGRSRANVYNTRLLAKCPLRHHNQILSALNTPLALLYFILLCEMNKHHTNVLAIRRTTRVCVTQLRTLSAHRVGSHIMLCSSL